MDYPAKISFITFIIISAAIFLFVEGYKLRKKEETELRLILKIIFYIYFIGVVYYTFFPIVIELYDPGFHFNLVPFEESIKVLNNSKSIGLYNIVGNIVLLLPLGIFIPLFYKKGENFFINITIILLSTLSIEFLQIFTSSRIGDIDDIIFNTIGGFIGFIIFRIIKFILSKYNKENIIENLQRENTSIIKTAVIFIVPIVVVMSLIIQIEKMKYIESITYLKNIINIEITK